MITLSDNAEGYPRGLATRCKENLAAAQIETPEVEDVMDVLDEVFKQMIAATFLVFDFETIKSCFLFYPNRPYFHLGEKV